MDEISKGRSSLQRALIEGGVIVASILMAFAVDAWWDSRGDKARTRALLSALSEDFETASARLERAQELQGRVLASAESLLTYAEAGGVPAAERGQVDSVFSRLFYSQMTYNPPTGTVETILSSGRLDLIDNDELISELTRWSSRMAHHKDREEAATEHFYKTLIPLLGPQVNLQDLDKAVPWDLPWPQDPTPAADLVSQQAFQSAIYMHYVLYRNLLATYPSIETSLSRVIELTRSELGG